MLGNCAAWVKLSDLANKTRLGSAQAVVSLHSDRQIQVRRSSKRLTVVNAFTDSDVSAYSVLHGVASVRLGDSEIGARLSGIVRLWPCFAASSECSEAFDFDRTRSAALRTDGLLLFRSAIGERGRGAEDGMEGAPSAKLNGVVEVKTPVALQHCHHLSIDASCRCCVVCVVLILAKGA